MYDIIVIGGGPAGITAAIYGVRAGKKVLILEANEVGGKIRQAHMVDNYPGVEHITGKELAKRFYEQAMDLGVEIKIEKAMSIMNDGERKVVQTLDNLYEGKTIVLATGNDRRELDVPGEEELLGKGVSYCATCDGNFFKKKDVCIVGGGEDSIDDALYLANLCNKVYFIVNRKMDLSKLENNNIEVLEKAKVVSINGENKVESVTVNVDGEERRLDVSGIFIAIADVPETSYLLNGLDIDDNGNVLANEDTLTVKGGVFVAGDLRVKGLRQVATAVADGAVAATQAVRFLNSHKNRGLVIKIHKKNLINETDILIDDKIISYRSLTEVPGTEEQLEEFVIEDKELIKKFVETVYKDNKENLFELHEKVKGIEKPTRSKNTATNNLTINDDGTELDFDCYIQEYENVPSMFTVEVEKYVKSIK